MPLAWLSYLLHSLYAINMVSMTLAWSSCLWHGLYAFGMVSMSLAWSPYLWHGHYALPPTAHYARVIWSYRVSIGNLDEYIWRFSNINF